MLLSGMSTIVVMPPAAAARVAVVEAFPLGAARLVDVHVRVDEPGHHDEIAGIDDLRASAAVSSYAADRVDARRP